MNSEQIRQLRFWFAGIALVMMGSIYGCSYFYQSRHVKEVMARGGRVEKAPNESPQLRQMYQWESRDPEGALKAADEIIAQSKSDYERKAAMGRRPGLLKNAAIKRFEAGDRAEALALREKLEKTYPASDQVGYLQRDWKRILANQAVKSLTSADPVASDVAYRELWAAGAGESERYAFDQRHEAFLRRWHRALEQKAPGATDLLFEVLTIQTHSSNLDQAARTMAQFPGTVAEMVALGEAQLKTERRHVVPVIWAGALAKFDATNFPKRDEKPAEAKQREVFRRVLKARIATGWMELAGRLQAGERIPFVFLSPRDAYAAAISHGKGEVEEMEALTKLIALEAADLNRLAKPLLAVTFEQLREPVVREKKEFSGFENQTNELATRIRDLVRDRGVRLWECCLETPGFDPWPTVPAAVREAIDSPPGQAAARGAAVAAKPPATATERRKKLLEHYRVDFWQTPLVELEPLTTLARQLYARSALFGLEGGTEGALVQLRWVMRAKDDPALQKSIVETLRERIVRSRQAGAFAQFYVLSGFYAAEVGFPGVGDPFREEFRAGLEAAAKGLRSREPMKYIFVLSLTAQCFADEPLGQKARTDAFTAAFEVVAARAPEQLGKPFFPSLVPGHSVQLINNNTDHHLLAFYRGPQAISAHSWPRRRGTVVLPDGDYEVVVLSPAENIVPYRAKGAFSLGTRVSDYTIQTTDRSGQTRSTPGAVATGDYKLLYAPPALGEVKVEPRSGMPMVGRAR